MQIVRSSIKDFQSIKDLDLEFDKFTVLVGPSSSGKSAALRALRALLRNTFVPTNVRQGSTKSVLSAEFVDGNIVSAERGKSLSTYRLNEDVFTKSGRSVPDEIADVVRLAEIQDVDASFSFQFDRPFLLSESGSTAATVIGSLTNVSALHAAVREANRRRGEVTSTLRVRKFDLEELTHRVEGFRGLPKRLKAIEMAQDTLDQARLLQGRLEALEASVADMQQSQDFLQSVQVPDVPDVHDKMSRIEDLIAYAARLEEIVEAIQINLTEVRQRSSVFSSAEKEVASLERRYTETLRASGKCPTCGQDTHKVGEMK